MSDGSRVWDRELGYAQVELVFAVGLDGRVLSDGDGGIGGGLLLASGEADGTSDDGGEGAEDAEG
jgi:hypothetical protein